MRRWRTLNQAYYFWAYGREASTACGAAVGPTPHSLGTAGSGTKTYKVVREYLNGAGWFYNLYLNSTGERLWQQTESSLQTCWASGVDGVQFMNEALNPNAQSGGSVSNHQTWSTVAYYSGSAWYSLTGSTGTNCTYHELSTMRCVWQTPSTWDSWDTRY